jgi:outer membrane receptor protein involved in Fe transport
LRYSSGHDRFHATLALSQAHWEDIQSDLVDAAGLPDTANIGNGNILAIEVQSDWRPWRSFKISGAIFANKSRLTSPAPGFEGEQDATLPNIASLGAQAELRYEVPVGDDSQLSFSASVRYQGKSRLGVGPVLSLPQGDHADTRLSAWWTCKPVSVSLDISNLLDAGRNVFALGNPFGVRTGNQITPMRPRTIRLGAAYKF